MAPQKSLQETIREDGLRIITKKVSYTKKTRLAVMALVGSAYDPPGSGGLFHFFEHMAFKGTNTKSYLDIQSLLARYCLSSSASTGKLQTIYWGESVYLNFENTCEIIFDMYQNSIFPKEEFQKEKEVILNEIARNNDDDSHCAYMTLYKLLWKYNPQRNYGTGTPEEVMGITREMLLKAKDQWYVPSNTVVIGTGRLEHSLLVDKANQAFPIDFRKVAHQYWDDECEQVPDIKEEIIKKSGRQKAIIVFGCKLPIFSDREMRAAIILGRMLGGGRDSLLHREIRSKKGLAYSVSGGIYGSRRQSSYFLCVRADVLPQKVEEVKQLMPEIICNYKLDKNHFQIMKERNMDGILVGLESPKDWQDIIIDKIIDNGEKLSCLNHCLARYLKIVSGIKYEEIVEMRKKILKPEKLACVIVEPI